MENELQRTFRRILDDDSSLSPNEARPVRSPVQTRSRMSLLALVLILVLVFVIVDPVKCLRRWKAKQFRELEPTVSHEDAQYAEYDPLFQPFD